MGKRRGGWVRDDLRAVKRAIRRGRQSVEFSDRAPGRTWHSLGDLNRLVVLIAEMNELMPDFASLGKRLEVLIKKARSRPQDPEIRALIRTLKRQSNRIARALRAKTPTPKTASPKRRAKAKRKRT